MSNELAVIEVKNPALVFVPQGLDPLINRIKEEVKKEQPNLDISTEAGRKAIASLAYKIAQSKTKLDKIGKELTEEQRLFIEGVNAERKRAWKELEELQDEVRKPLTEWETAEKVRIERHETAIARMIELSDFSMPHTREDIEKRIDHLALIFDRDWQEFGMRAEYTNKTVWETLQVQHKALWKAETDAAELARLRAAEDARLQKERDEKIAADAAAEATRQAEEKAAQELKAEQDKAAAARRRRTTKPRLFRINWIRQSATRRRRPKR